jgi:hypothetical protein
MPAARGNKDLPQGRVGGGAHASGARIAALRGVELESDHMPEA